jgi:probable RNA-binding protein EIF1AD
MSSKATKTRFVTTKLDTEFVLPADNEIVGKVIAARGRDLFNVLDADGNEYLASMPTRFRTTVYVKRDQFVYLMPIGEGQKVRAEITHVLDAETILYVREQNLWPARFKDDAIALMRTSKQKPGDIIDEDMLPPNISDSEEANSDSTGENSDDEPSVYNPNRVM